MKTWSRGTNSRLPFGVNVNLNLSNSKNILTLAPYSSEQVKYGKEKSYPVLNLFTSNERAKLNIRETIPDSILLKGE